MKKIVLISLLLLSTLFSYSSNIQAAYAIGIFDKNGMGENIQHKRKSIYNYNGECYSKIVVFGFLNNSIPKVSIGNSIGSFVKSVSIYNKLKIKIGEVITFKHYALSSGYFKVEINNKLYDSKVFIK